MKQLELLTYRDSKPALWRQKKVPYRYMIHGRCISAHVETKMLLEKKATSFNTAGAKIRC